MMTMFAKRAPCWNPGRRQASSSLKTDGLPRSWTHYERVERTCCRGYISHKVMKSVEATDPS